MACEEFASVGPMIGTSCNASAVKLTRDYRHSLVDKRLLGHHAAAASRIFSITGDEKARVCGEMALVRRGQETAWVRTH